MIFVKIAELFRTKSKIRKMSLFDFITKTSDDEKKVFLKDVVERAKADQREMVKKARLIKN